MSEKKSAAGLNRIITVCKEYSEVNFDCLHGQNKKIWPSQDVKGIVRDFVGDMDSRRRFFLSDILLPESTYFKRAECYCCQERVYLLLI